MYLEEPLIFRLHHLFLKENFTVGAKTVNTLILMGVTLFSKHGKTRHFAGLTGNFLVGCEENDHFYLCKRFFHPSINMSFFSFLQPFHTLREFSQKKRLPYF